jgi:ABC-2 type transport system ATP-binding protein
MDEAEICDQVAIIDNGKIIAMDRPFELKKQYTKDKAYITCTDQIEFEVSLRMAELPYKKKETHYSIEITDLPLLMEIISKHSETITDIEIKKGTLNDVFLEITGRDMRE